MTIKEESKKPFFHRIREKVLEKWKSFSDKTQTFIGIVLIILLGGIACSPILVFSSDGFFSSIPYKIPVFLVLSGIFLTVFSILPFKYISGLSKTLKAFYGWEDSIAVLLLVYGIFCFWMQPTVGFLEEFRAELIGAGIATLLIGNASQAAQIREEKKRLILQMGSPDNSFAIEAVRQLREQGWLTDGSLKGAFLRKANLSGADLELANLSKAELSGAILSEAELSGAILSEADLRQANLSGARLGHANLSGASLVQANLSEANLDSANLSGSDLNFTKLIRAYLCNGNLSGAKLAGTKLSEAKMGWANLSGAELQSADLRGASLHYAILIGTYLKNTDLREAYLPRVDLSEADLQESNLSGANLEGAILSNKDLQSVNLSGAHLNWANLSGANLQSVNLSGADLRWSNLSGAKLKGTNLSGADLKGANLSGAILEKIFLSGVKPHDDSLIVSTLFDETTKWKDALYTEGEKGTIFPEGFNPVDFKMYLIHDDETVEEVYKKISPAGTFYTYDPY